MRLINLMKIHHKTIWEQDLKKGKVKEEIFKEDFLHFLDIGFIDVSNDKEYQKKDVDLVLQKVMGNIDVKSYKDRNYISLEEMNCVESGRKGWMYESEANFFVFVSTNTRAMLILKNDKELQNWWQINKTRFQLKTNETKSKDSIWHSQYRNIPLKELNIMWVKKNNQYKKPPELKIVNTTPCEKCEYPIEEYNNGLVNLPCSRCGWYP